MSKNLNEGFVLKRTVTKAEAVSLLTQRFPEVSAVCEPSTDSDTPQPFYAYERLSEEIERRRGDPLFLQSAARFIDELARSGDSLLENLLYVSVLERLAVDPEMVRLIRPHIGKEATSMLDTVERDFFGRTSSE